MSAWSLAVVMPLYAGATAQPKLLDLRLGRRGRVDAAREPRVRLVHREVARLELVALVEQVAADLGGGRDEVVLPDAVVVPLLAASRRASGIWAVLPSAARNEPGPKSDDSASGLLSAVLHVEAPLDDVRRVELRRWSRRCRSCRR